MKVLITHELFPPDFAGGGEHLVLNMAKNLQKKGINVKVLTTGNPKISEFEGIRTIRLKINRYLMNFSLFSILKHAKDVDLIQTSNYNAAFPSWLAAKILRKPVLCFAFGLYGKRWLKMRGFFFGTISRIIEKIQLKRSFDKLLFLSDYSKDWGLEIGIKEKITQVINPGVELKNYKPLKKQDFVLFSGRFANQKGVHDIIKVAKKLPKIRFVMMGWGEEEQKLRKDAPKNVEFSNLSLKSGKKFFEMYGKAPIFFLPSYGETFGFVLVEAMASGCAIISTIPLGFEGIMVKPGDIDGMAKAIDKLVKDKNLVQDMGKKNISKSKYYNWDRFTDEILELYGKILKKYNSQ